MNGKMIAVTGATGQQGGAVARKLLAGGWRVRALTRDISKPVAQELKALGAELLPGDLDQRAELEAAFEGAYGVFSVQNFWLPNVGFEGEIRQGKLVADLAKEAGIQHLVYTSVGGADRAPGVMHFESKWEIEQYVQSLGIPYTILRPVFFMDNFNWSRPYILNGTLTSIGLRAEKGLQLIAVEDIGAFAVLAFEKPEEYLGKTMEIAGDELTEAQIAEIFSRVIGRPVSLGKAERTDEERDAMLRFFNDRGYTADITALRRLHPELLRLEEYLRKNGWENQQPIPIPENTGWGRS